MRNILKHGDKDSDLPAGSEFTVSQLQEMLNQWTLDFSSGQAEPLVVDGHFGDATLCRVLNFQTHTLEPGTSSSTIDGVVGDITWSALIRITSADTAFLSVAEPIERTPWETELPQRLPEDSDLGFKALEIAIQELRSDAREIGKNNEGEFVRKYLRSEEKNPWCAGFVSWCYMTAVDGLENMPFRYSLGARDIYEQFEASGAAHPHSSGYVPVAGDLAVWSRCYENSVGSGHIAIVHTYTDEVLRTIDGNKGRFPSYVKGLEHRHDQWQPELLGFCDIRTMQSQVGFG
jgi:hypothetical protein